MTSQVPFWDWSEFCTSWLTALSLLLHQETAHGEVRGAVVAVATDVDLASGRWTLGPQFKLCLSDSLIR